MFHGVHTTNKSVIFREIYTHEYTSKWENNIRDVNNNRNWEEKTRRQQKRKKERTNETEIKNKNKMKSIHTTRRNFNITTPFIRIECDGAKSLKVNSEIPKFTFTEWLNWIGRVKRERYSIHRDEYTHTRWSTLKHREIMLKSQCQEI